MQLVIVTWREPVKTYGESGFGKSKTIPNQSMNINQIVDRTNRGQTVIQKEGIYIGDKLPEIVNFENLDTLDQIDLVRELVADKGAKNQKVVDEIKAKQKEIDDKKADENLAKIKADAIKEFVEKQK